jgi:uncharacterized membrane protein
MDVMNIFESFFRWLHIIAGVFWIGHLYFFNFVNAHLGPALDAATRQKVVPELMPRALFWFRWGAAFTWVTGILLLGMVYYMSTALLFDAGNTWNVGALVMIALVFIAPFIYDVLAKGPMKEPNIMFWGGVVLATVMLFLFDYVAGFSFRGYAIHLGGLFGTIMAFNVWFRIWPAQQQIITAVKNGQAPDAALVAMAGGRSKHNTYMSVPLLFMMMAQHATWAANPLILGGVVLFGFALTYHLYDRAKNVKGF